MKKIIDFGHIVRQYLINKGIRVRTQATLIAQILNITETQARRKMQGKTGWQVTQLETIANHFDEHVISFFQQGELNSESSSDNTVDAIIHLAEDIPCRTSIGKPWTKNMEIPGVVAKMQDQIWHIYQSKNIILSETGYFYTVKAVNFNDPKILYKPLVAVIDDNDANSTVKILESHNFAAIPYFNLNDFIESLKTKPVDVIVLDWVFSNEGASSYLEKITAITKGRIPIIVFTGFALEYQVELSYAIANNNITLLTKPMAHWVLASHISNLIKLNSPKI